MTKKEFEAVRLERVRQLFKARPFAEHTENGVLKFYGWLHRHYPELLPNERGDPYKHLKVDLSGLYK
jgi:hypothetical protein